MPRDKQTITAIAGAHPDVREKMFLAVDRAEKNLPEWVAIRAVQVYRSFSEQNRLFALGRTVVNPVGITAKKPKGNIVTNATGGKSLHNYGLAMDFAILIDKDRNGTYEELSWDMLNDSDADGVLDWQEVVEAFKFYGFKWGGDWRSFKDYPHCDMDFGHDWRWYEAKFKAGDFIPGTKFIKIAA